MARRTLNCKVCHEPFESERFARGRPPSYCSDECRREYHNNEMRIRYHRESKSTTKRKVNVRFRTVKCVCEECNKEFTYQKARGPLKKYCDEKCRKKAWDKWHIKYRKEKGIVDYNLGDLIQCKRCGEMFEATRGCKRQCKECKDRSYEIQDCAYCGEKYDPQLIKGGKREKYRGWYKYCSERCFRQRRVNWQRQYDRRVGKSGSKPYKSAKEWWCHWCGNKVDRMTSGHVKTCSEDCHQERKRVPVEERERRFNELFPDGYPQEGTD